VIPGHHFGKTQTTSGQPQVSMLCYGVEPAPGIAMISRFWPDARR
jgi:hypothetical protein